MSREQIFTHNQLKQEFNLVMGGLVKAERLGRFFPDGVLLTNDRAQLACQPDGTFVGRQALKLGASAWWKLKKKAISSSRARRTWSLKS